MRSDPTQDKAFRTLDSWKSPLLNFNLSVPQSKSAPSGSPVYLSNSFSGNERNRLLIAGENGFSDRSLVSGVDCREDARSFAVLDYDGDGWLDIALVSINAPRFRLFRNRFGELGSTGRVVQIQLRGGNESSQASIGMSNRDGIGALLKVTTSRGKRIYRRSAGEGLSSQNSAAIRVTLMEGESLDRVEVLWPSGIVTEFDPIPSKAMMEISESGKLGK